MNKELITDVFFDLDHTLWDFDKNSGLAFKQVFNKHVIDIQVEEFLKVYEPINFEYWRLFRNEEVSKQELRRGRLTDAFKEFNIHFSIKVIDEMADSYIDELPKNNYLFDGAKDVLKYLSNKYSLHIITNGFEEVQHKKIKNSGIRNFFKTITTSEEVGVKKPNPVIFIKSMEKAETISNKSIMIGDSFEADILGAKKVGMQTIFYNYRKEKVINNNLTVNNLQDLKKYI